MKTRNQSGISAVLVLGVIAVLLTIVIPLVSRTVTDLRISRQQEEQARAFSVAETGLERALVGEEVGVLRVEGDIEYEVTTGTLGGGGGGNDYVYPKSISQDTPATIWLVSHDDTSGDGEFNPDALWVKGVSPMFTGNTLDVYWGEDKTYTDVSEVPALEATLVYQDTDDQYKVKRYLYDPAGSLGFVRDDMGSTSLAGSGGSLGAGDNEVSFEWMATLNGMSCDTVTCFLLRLRIIFAPEDIHPVGIDFSGDSLPRQGECYDSLAKVQTSGISSRVQRCILYRDFPPVFDFAMYSGGDLTKGN